MSTNHNRIKVADLEINEPNKTLITNDNGELEFSDVTGGGQDLQSVLSNGSQASSTIYMNVANINFNQGGVFFQGGASNSAALNHYGLDIYKTSFSDGVSVGNGRITFTSAVDTDNSKVISISRSNPFIAQQYQLHLPDKPVGTYTMATLDDIPSISGLATITYVDTQNDLKIDKVAGERLINAAEITKLANQSNVNTGDNAVNSNYSSDYRASNFVAGTNYLAPNGSASALTGFPTLNQNTTGTAATITGDISESQVTNLVSDLAAKQSTLVSGTNIKTINGSSILGSGDLVISGGGGVDATALHQTGNETFTGIKSAINTTNTVTNAIELTNSPSSHAGSNTHALKIVNSGLNGKGLSIINSSAVGEGFRLMHSGIAAGMVIGCNNTSTTDVPMLIDISNGSPKGNCMRIHNGATSANDGVQTQGLGLIITGSTGSGTSLRISHLSTQVNSPAVSIDSSGGNLALKTSGDIECGKYKVPTLNIAPSSATATGTTGEIRFTAAGIFICTATNTWIKCVGASF
jgi:hypothetical protein